MGDRSAILPAMANQLVTITDDNFKAEVLQSSLPFLLFFTAPWCGPCRQITPSLEEMTTTYSGRVVIGAADVDTEMGLVESYSITNVPAYVLFKAGASVAQSATLLNPPEIEQFINTNLQTA